MGTRYDVLNDIVCSRVKNVIFLVHSNCSSGIARLFGLGVKVVLQVNHVGDADHSHMAYNQHKARMVFFGSPPSKYFLRNHRFERPSVKLILRFAHFPAVEDFDSKRNRIVDDLDPEVDCRNVLLPGE